jgi:D-xylose transport system permease protein
VPVLILVAAVVLMEFAARETRFGRYVYAIGGGKEAAELAGIKVKRTVVAVFVLTGVLAGIAAVITTARLNAGTNSLGSLLELNVIAAAVIGGASLSGGRGSVSGAILGAVVIQSLETGLVLVGSTSSVRMIVIGLVLMLAARFDRVLTRRDGDAA